MSVIDDYLNAGRKTYSDTVLGIYENKLAREKREEEERRKLLEEQQKLNDEAATVRKELGIDLGESLFQQTREIAEQNKTLAQRIADPITNVLTLGIPKAIEEQKQKEAQAPLYDNALKKLEQNKDEYVKRMGNENYNKLWLELNSKGTNKNSVIEGYASDVNIGDLQVKRNSAWDQYMRTYRQSDKELAEMYDQALEQYGFSNPDVGKNTFSGTANYIPQSIYYTKKNLPAAALGLSSVAAGYYLGAPEIGKAIGKGIYSLGTVASGFQGTMEQTRGAEFGDMVKLGIPENIAKKAANESAFWQALIEEGETAVGLLNAFKVPQQASKMNALKKFFKNWGVNIVTEGLEEGSQSVVGYVYQWDAMDRAGVDTSDMSFGNMVEQAWEEAKGGAEIGLTMYFAEGVPHIIMGKITNSVGERNAQRQFIADVPIGTALYKIEQKVNFDEYGNAKDVPQDFIKRELNQAYGQEIARLKGAQRLALTEGEKADIQKVIDVTEKGRQKVTSDKGIASITKEINKELDTQVVNKEQKLNKTTRTYATKVLKDVQEIERADERFKNIEFSVANRLTTGQKFAQQLMKSAGVDVVFYNVKNYKNSTSIYKHRGFIPDPNNKVILINAGIRNTKNVMAVIGHEYAHHYVKVADDAQKFFNMYTNNEALLYARQKGLWNKKGFATQEQYNKWKEEMFADDVGEYLSTEEAVNGIRNGDQSIMKAIKDKLTTFVENETGYTPKFNDVTQFNLSGQSVLNGNNLSQDITKGVMENINKEQQEKSGKKKLSKKETTKTEVSKTETKSASRLTSQQKENYTWYKEQREDNRGRDAIQKSLATRMKKGVNSEEVKAEMARLEKKYNQENSVKRSAEIVDDTAKEKNPKMYNNLGERLSPGIMKKYRNSKIRDKNGNLLVVYHTTTETMLVPFSEFKPEKEGKYYNYKGQTVIFVTPNLAMSLSYMQMEKMGSFDTLEDILNTDALRVVKNKKVKSIKEAKELLPYFVDIKKTKDGKITLVNTTTGSTWGQYENFKEFSESLNDLIDAKNRDYIDLEDERRGQSVGKDRFWQYPMYMNVENPFVVDGKGKYWNKIIMNLPRGVEEARKNYEAAKANAGVMAALGNVMGDIINEEQSTPDSWYNKYAKKAAEKYGIDELRYTAEKLLGITGDIVKYIEGKYGDEWATDLENKRKEDYDEFTDGLVEAGRDVMMKYSDLLEKTLKELTPRSAVAGLLYENRRSIPYSTEKFRYMMFRYLRSLIGDDWEYLGWKEIEENQGSYFAKDAVMDLEIMFDSRAGTFDIDKSEYSEYSRDRNRRARKLKRQEDILQFETNDIVKIALRRNFQKNVANLKKTSEAIQNMGKSAKQKLGYAMVSNYYEILANGIDAKSYDSLGEAFSSFVIRDISADKELDGIRKELEKNPKILEQFFGYFREKVPSQLYPHSFNIGDDVVYGLSEKQLNAIFEKSINEKNISYLKGDFLKPERYRAENALLNSYDTDEEKTNRVKLVVSEVKRKIYSEPVNLLNKFLNDWRYNTSQEEILAVGGYDGVWIKNIMDFGNRMPEGLYVPNDIYIAFASNQVDLIDNKNPTMSPNIKRSTEVTDDTVPKQKWNGRASDVRNRLVKYANNLKLKDGYKINVDGSRDGGNKIVVSLRKDTYDGMVVDEDGNRVSKTQTVKEFEASTSDFKDKESFVKSVKDKMQREFKDAIKQSKLQRTLDELKETKAENRGRKKAIRWTWKKEEQQKKQSNRWKAKAEKGERTILGMRARAQENRRVKALNAARRELIKRIRTFEKSKTFKFMTDEQKKQYEETFGNIYKGGISKKARTRQLELIKANIASQLIDDPNVVVSTKVKNMVKAPNKVTLDAVETIEQVNELLDAYKKIVEQTQKQQQLVGLKKNEDALEQQEEFAEAVRELEEKHDSKERALTAKQQEREESPIGKIVNKLQEGATKTGEALSSFFETALSTIETELLRIAEGNRKSKIMKIYENLNEGVTRERAVITNLRSILNKYLTEKEYKELRKSLNPKSDWVDTGVEVTDIRGRKHKLVLDHGRLMALAMHSMQEQSLKHIGGAITDIWFDEDGDPDLKDIKGGGLTIPSMKYVKQGDLRRAVAEGYTVVLSPAEINDIVGKSTDTNGDVTFKNLTAEENEFIKAMQEFFKQTREYTNEVYRTLHGFDMPTVENYFPIVANKAWIFKEKPDNLTYQQAAKAYGMFDKEGFVQDRKNDAYNPIVLENVADVLTRMTNGVAKYYGYNIALHNNEILLSTQDKKSGFNVEEALGKLAPKFKDDYETLTGFISGIKAQPYDIVARFRGRHAEFTLGLNPSSWVKQLLSVPTTIKYFTVKELAGFVGGGEKALYDAMKSYLEMTGEYEKGKVLQNFAGHLTNDLAYRNELFGLVDMSDAIDNKSLFERMDILKGIARFDKLGVTTVTRMFLYAELSRRNLLGDELTKISAEEADRIFQDIGYELERFLRQTQPDYSQTYRANITRNTGSFARFITMYSTPTLQMTNNMLQSAYELNYAIRNGENVGAAWNKMIKSALGVFLASLGSVLISRAVSKLLKGDDDDEDYDFGKELIVSMLAPTLVLDDLARGFLGMNTYESQTPELIAIDALIEIGSSLNEIWTGEPQNAYSKWKKIVTNAGLLFGIPARDIYKLGKAALMYAQSDLYWQMSLRENPNAYKKFIETEGSPDTKDFYRAYTATREKVLIAKYGYHKADKEKNIKSNKKEAFRKALVDVFGNDTKKVNQYMTILGGYKS